MNLSNIPNVDKKELSQLIAEARKADDFSSNRLGELVSNIVKKILVSERYVGYTEDWQAEMFSEGVLSIYSAIFNTQINMNDSFDYCYTCALNRIKRALDSLNNNIPAETLTEIESDPFYIRNKRRIVRGFFDKKAEDEVVERHSKKRRPLKNAVGLSARCFGDSFKEGTLDNLIELARKVRT